MEIILISSAIFILFIKYIVPIVLILLTIIWTLKTKSISKTFKIIIIAIISLCVFITLNNFKTETPDNLYTEMKEKYDSQSFIGLSKEDIVEFLGKPDEYDREEREYVYFAGQVFKEWCWGKCYSTKYYQIKVFFDENDKVKSTLIEEYIPHGG